MISASGPGGGFVRLAMPRDVPTVAALQRTAWAARGLADMLPQPARAEEIWLAAVLAPPLASYRVLVALDATRSRLTGFAAIGPSEDPDAGPQDALVGEFVVAPAEQGAGHGSRLLNAVADTLRADGFTRATWWLPSTDDGLRAFLVAGGWAPDGAHRELGTEDGGRRIKQVRMHTGLA